MIGLSNIVLEAPLLSKFRRDAPPGPVLSGKVPIKDLDPKDRENIWFAFGNPVRTLFSFNESDNKLLLSTNLCIPPSTDPSRGREILDTACHLIRSSIISAKPHLILGCEWETVFNPEVLSYSRRILNNIKPLAPHVSSKGKIIMTHAPGKIPTWYENLLAWDIDDGQKKLYCLMRGFASYRNILYIGSAPGNGWQRALHDLKFSGKVLSVDPRPLELASNISFSITHIQTPFSDWKSLHSANLDFFSEPFNFFWDLQKDYPDSESKHAGIISEIESLNALISDPTFTPVFLSLKVRMASLPAYKFRDNVTLYLQGFYLDRCAFGEVRANFYNYGGFISYPLSVSEKYFEDIYSFSKSEIKQLDYHAVKSCPSLNFWIFDLRCLISEPFSSYIRDHAFALPNNDALKVVALFVLNWIPTEDVFHLINNKILNLLGSFFARRKLRDGEFDHSNLFVDKFLPLLGHSSLFDSRVFNVQKINHLYFFSNDQYCLNLYDKQIVISESYHFRTISSDIMYVLGYDTYDMIRYAAAISLGLCNGCSTVHQYTIFT